MIRKNDLGVKRFYRSISVLLIASMILTIAPINIRQAMAFEQDNFSIDRINIGKTFDENGNLTTVFFTITGKSLQNAQVTVMAGGRPYTLTGPKTNTDGILYFEYTDPKSWNDFQGITDIYIGGVQIPISKSQMPTVTDVEPRTVEKGGSLTIKGTDFSLIYNNNLEFTVKYGRGFTYQTISDDKFTGDSVTVNDVTGELGLQDIVFERRWQTDDIKFNVNNTGKVNIDIIYSYSDQFRLVQPLNISDDLEMFPNRGTAGSKVFFKADTLDNYDVYFLKAIDGTDPYTAANRAKNPSFKQDAEGNKDVLTVEVPAIGKGEYYVVITNKVPEGRDPMEEITGEKILPVKFTVIEGGRSATIDAIQPASGPDTGSTAVISGRFLGSLNIDGLVLDEGIPIKIDITSDPSTMLITYGDGSSEIATYNGASVTSITKQVGVIVGDKATFRDGSTFSSEMDKLNINVSPITITDGDYVKDVVVETRTTLKLSDGRTYYFTERAEKADSYTFIPSTVKPEVQGVVPEEIHASSDGSGGYEVPQDLMISINGKNLAIYKDANGIRYPVVQFGSMSDADRIVLDKNLQPNLELSVQDSSGNVLDGTPGNESGTRITVVIPKGTKVPESFLNTSVPVIVINPIRNSDKSGLSSDAGVTVKFLTAKADKIPVIESVTPDVVTVDGGETVTIKGSNFREDVKVFIDGKEVTGINRGGNGSTITFKAPPGKEGKTQLQVLNPGGGTAVTDFYYVKTYTDPKITDFAPKAGNTGTLVQVKGDNFLSPDPTASSDEIYKLIGTRILLEGQDVNQYNVDPVSKKIELKNYKSPLIDDTSNPDLKKLYKIIEVDTNPDGTKYVKLADYWYSVIFKDEKTGRFYTINLDSQGYPILSDGVNNTYKIVVKNDKLYASQEGGGDYSISVDDSDSDVTKVIIGEGDTAVTLDMMTLYKVDEKGLIVGSNVKVIDKNTIIFKVPILTLGDGWYDLTVLNPDTKRDSRLNEQGFYYYSHPQTRPVIDTIVPDKGSTDGGYTIDINGQQFYDDGLNKSRVFINGVEVKKEDTFVSVDGKKITVKVPPYEGDLLREKGTDRIAVPVVVLNPDGSSASREEGFTYIVPTSHPQITRIVPQKGSAAGGEVVEIFGTDFRFFEPFSDDNRNQIRDESEPYQDISGNGEWSDFTGKTAEELKQNPETYGINALSVLPKVYFGNKAAEILEFSAGYIKVIAPLGSAGDVDVYVVNNDSGISNSVKYTYVSSKPVVTKIVPSEGKKQGGDRIEIFGSDFVKSNNIKVYNSSAAPDVLVRFGDITNRDIPRDQENSGRIDNGRTTVNLAGGLTVEYTNSPEYGGQGQVKIQISEKGATYVSGNISYDGSVMFFPVSLLKDTSNNNSPYPGQELIRLEIQDRRLLVERGYAPQVTYIDGGHLEVTTPSYYTIGNVNVYVINPDGGVAQGQFEYKNPASSPVIVNITKEGNPPQKENIDGRDVMVQYVSFKGGNIISVIGSDFRENAKIQISDVATIDPKNITYTLPTKLTFTMPAVPESAIGKLHRVVVINEDGGNASSDEASPPIYIMFTKGETAPSVGNITPDHGPSTGGTTVKIEGKDFREGLKVYFGEVTVPQENVKVVDYKTIIVITPPHAPGKVEVKVENPDGELSTAGTFTYISNPEISSVVDPQDPTEATRLTEISVEGGQEIKIKGSGFMDGARVVFNPSVEAADESQTPTGTVIYIDGRAYVLDDGVDGSDVKFIDSETLTVKTPPGKAGTGGVMVINPDGGATDIYDDIIYGLPKLEAPMDVTAELSYDRYIKVNWSRVEKASQYEVYVIIDEESMEFLDSTELTSYMYTDLEPHTRYKFVVKAVGDFGSSAPSAESNTVRTGEIAGPPDQDGKITDDTKFQASGDTQNVIIGVKDYTKLVTIDLTDQAAYKSNSVMVQIPAKVVVKNDAGDIAIIGKQFTIKFNPRVFSTPRVYDAKNRDDAGVRFTVTPYEGSSDLSGETALSSQYVLKAEFFVGKDFYSLDYLASSIEIDMSYDKAKAQLRRLYHITLGRYDGERDAWDATAAHTTGIIGSTVRAYVDRLGRYAVIGSRR